MQRKWIFTEHSGLYEALCCTERFTFLWCDIVLATKKLQYLSMDYEDMNYLSINGCKWSYAQMFYLFQWNNMEAHFHQGIKKEKR